MSVLIWIFATALLASFIPLLILVARNYAKHRGPRVVVCPETRTPVAVEVNATRAAWSAVLGDPEFRLRSCSRWPERQDCGRECLSQIEAAPEDCKARAMLARWYEGSSCALCGKEIGEIRWMDHRPALLSPQGRTIGWEEIAPETLERVFATHRRVCWDCHVAESFRRRHPELVVEDPWHRGRRSPDSRASRLS